jgi:hypothetical protein
LLQVALSSVIVSIAANCACPLSLHRRWNSDADNAARSRLRDPLRALQLVALLGRSIWWRNQKGHATFFRVLRARLYVVLEVFFLESLTTIFTLKSN